jgi:ribA/ribD-fused uncharacterized protein
MATGSPPMSSDSDSTSPSRAKLRTYERDDVVVVYKTKERFGELSNMSAGFPLIVNQIRILTSEALYQACRFPHMPEVQRKIIAQKSPMTAKMVGKPFRTKSRADWDAVRVRIMRWCLRVKLAQHWDSFGQILLATKDRPIVEQSRRDAYWGATINEGLHNVLVGENVLGRLLMELREQLKSDEGAKLHSVDPLTIPQFTLLGMPIEAIKRVATVRIGRLNETIDNSALISAHDPHRHKGNWMSSIFQNRQVDVSTNHKVRVPQKEVFQALLTFAGETPQSEREVGIVLPVGCGKSGCIALAPFAFRSRRSLVVAPGIHIAHQLTAEFDPSRPDMFYKKYGILRDGPYPEPVEIRGKDTNRTDLEEADVVITNVQQLQGEENRWLDVLPPDFFDLILFDEGHHSIAETWEALKSHFPSARIVNFSATPLRADGQLMAGRIIYSYPVASAIKNGFVKRLKAVQLNPRTLRYVRREDSQEIEVSLDEVRRLGETEADFRRSIVTSTETLNTIVDASIRELARVRSQTGEGRLKIIASALNFEHCRQIVEAYSARGQRAGYVHSKEDGKANERVMRRLENHELDVIVQVRKLGEGFNHPYLSVAAVFSIYSNLSPFVQFVGRIMRVIVQEAPKSPLNQGVVVFHAGANVARQWADFQAYSEADQAYFNELLPLESFDPADTSTIREIEPAYRDADVMEVRSQTEIHLEEIPLVEADESAAIQLLKDRGIIAADFDPSHQILEPVDSTRLAQRRAKRASLDMRVKTEAARILHQRGINVAGRELDRQYLGRENVVVFKAAIDRQINTAVGQKSGERHELSRAQLDQIDLIFDELVAAAVEEMFGVH